MKLSLNAIVQGVATAVQTANLLSPMFGPKTKESLAVIITAVQAVTGLVAHFNNPDGTSASKAYEPWREQS